MRVTFVLPDANHGGGTRMIAQHADNLRRRGHSVVIVSTPRANYSFKQKVRMLLRGEKWPKTRKRDASHLDGLDLEHRVLNRRRPVTDRDVPDADVVIATWWETAKGVARLSPSKGAKAYFIQHYEALLGQKSDEVDATWRLPLQKITCGSWMADLARDKFDDPDVLLVKNGLDINLFDAPERGRQARPTMGMLYAQSAAKGWDAGMKVFELASERVPGLQLRAFGQVPPSTSLPPETFFTSSPPQPEIPSLYAGCDVWLCPSRSEGYHMPPIEAMGCRCPAVSTRVSGPADVIEDGVNGYLVDIEDVAALTDRIVRVLEFPFPRWKAMSDAAYARARAYSAWDATGLFEQALFTTIERSSGRAALAPEMGRLLV